MNKRTRNCIIFSVLVAVLLAVDLVSKYLTDKVYCNVIPNFLDFNSVYNEGIGFGFFAGMTTMLIIISSVLTVGAFFAWWFYGRDNLLVNIAFAFFICGAAGNLFDRIVFGYVRDFLDFLWFKSIVINCADIWLNIGCAILCVVLIYSSFKKAEKK